MSSWDHRYRIALVLALTAWAVVCAFVPHLPVNPASRYAAIEALVEHGTWAIDDTSLLRSTVDKVYWGEHFYSSKPPLLPLLLTPFYALWRLWTGTGFADDAYAAAAWMRLFSGILPWLLGCAAVSALLDRFARHTATRVVGFTAWSAGSLATAYAAHLDNHSWAVAAILLGALALAPVVDDDPDGARPILGGAAFGLAFAFDLGAGPTVGLLGAVFVVLSIRAGRIGDAVAFTLAALAPVLAQALIQWQIAGTPKPFYLLGEAYDYPGSYWNRMVEFDALTEPKLVYAFHALFGHHGLFSVTPWLLAGVLGLCVVPEGAARRAVHAAAVAAVLFTVIYYVARTTNYGGRCVGMRWYMVIHPTLWVGLVLGLDRRPSWRTPVGLAAIAALVAMGVVSALHGMMNPWEEGLVHGFYRAFGMGSVDG